MPTRRTTRRVIIVVAGILGVILGVIIGTITGARAADRTPTTTVLRVMPGTAGHVFRNGDPIRICAMTVTDHTVDGATTLRFEARTKPGAPWQTITDATIAPNRMGCLYAVVHDAGVTKLRVRTLRSTTLDWSASRHVRIEVR